MEFYHRKDLPKKPFNLDLSDVELWDHVQAGRLQPFTRPKPIVIASHTDSISTDPGYHPIFPGPFQEKYERLRGLRYSIYYNEQFLSKGTNEAGKFPPTDSSSRKVKTELASESEEARKLYMEFADIPQLYQQFNKISGSDAEREYFVEQLNDAYYRRDQIESLMERPKGKNISDTALAQKKLQNYVKTYVKKGFITSRDDLRHDPEIARWQKEQGWSDGTVDDYTRNLGIPHKKRGRKPKANRT